MLYSNNTVIKPPLGRIKPPARAQSLPGGFPFQVASKAV
ncbi:hypothetical protein CES85_4458 [Ochrobactrum quorumnocens]|uniref:Uncharacterized protein n=1 Tax=Ochrobactrum quorumnocens TaxID=271865 RepID=A0A248UAI0_9HYPH|nr:hypothetical protein CES85_4458 [[Ochrobactrum] quorumnocens]